MKLCLGIAPKKPIDRPFAWGCLTSNLALPGVGTLAAGRAVGYLQLALAGLGLTLSLVFGIQFIRWTFSHWAELQEPPEDVAARLLSLWIQVRWTLAGLACFAVAWLWGLWTGLQLLRAARRGGPPPLDRATNQLST
jgi:hypothetical protein